MDEEQNYGFIFNSYKGSPDIVHVGKHTFTATLIGIQALGFLKLQFPHIMNPFDLREKPSASGWNVDPDYKRAAILDDIKHKVRKPVEYEPLRFQPRQGESDWNVKW
eukprot:CAMPEP_0175078638 /NCGR_PEP_ID=MMETSP0052_2-20121109/24265_1 /TAXON_ID=51329 ORGANISM="Polytomella parva, Strain SAG 63-3" /NCGR_SAMPLE_ID=MMETSP0052_2 /ASSEMBLY_ACC=CAM_ASM_000194 /LENGTH=106 /DNA_ID=CAMNT_0016348653 /DNA_START=14 /DNA_END=331 /DNA_ORIENTATION=+